MADVSADRRKSLLKSHGPQIIRAIAAAALMGASVIAVMSSRSEPPVAAAIRKGAAKYSPETAGARASDDQHQQRVLGVWHDDYQGKRTLTVRPDGTATMLVEFDGWKARMFTPKLRLETTWSIEDGRFNRETIGGEPADKVDFVRRRVGDQASDRIVKLTADRMVLIDQDGETRYNWRRTQ
jgi:hypothetical protein